MMSQRLYEYFIEEATEYLDELEGILSLAGYPDADQFLRLATGVRGSAQMAEAGTIASVAERLEDAARSIVSQDIAWSEEVRDLSLRTVSDLKLLVRALGRWGELEERRVREAIERWDDLAGSADGESARDIVPIRVLLYDDDPGAHQAGRDGDGAETESVVPIETLLLRGEAALREALRLRSDFERAAGGSADPQGPLEALVRELFELLELAADGDRPRE